MTEASMELMHELLKEMNGTLRKLEGGQRLANERLAAIDHHMAGFHQSGGVHGEETEALKDRIRQIEKRLDLRD